MQVFLIEIKCLTNIAISLKVYAIVYTITNINNPPPICRLKYCSASFLK